MRHIVKEEIMDINKFKLLNYYYNLSLNRKNILLDKRTEHVLNNSKIEKDLTTNGLLENKQLTQKGIEALQPYKVNNAVILAADLRLALYRCH